jgi:hypothetical protein
MTKRAYIVDPSVDPSSLPFEFDGDRMITCPFDGTGYVEVDGSLPGGNEVPLRVVEVPVQE